MQLAGFFHPASPTPLSIDKKNTSLAFSGLSHRNQHHSRPSRYQRRPHRHARRALPAAHARTDIAHDALLAAVPSSRASSPSASPPSRPPTSPTSLPRSHLPAALTVPCVRPPGAVPVSYPMHAVVLAVHCAKFPRLSPSVPVGSSHTASVTLPVLPLTLPYPHAFAVLHAFMYTHRLAPALAALLPLPAFLTSSSHGRSGEELTHAALLATLPCPPAPHVLALYLCASSQPKRAHGPRGPR
ncbi:hypothetical protein DFH09DRAFT_1338544 [Mycena vulgaris]|nr:hypothetical protein DFH09DRAFT_1338544 [Mycena vulgaris]